METFHPNRRTLKNNANDLRSREFRKAVSTSLLCTHLFPILKHTTKNKIIQSVIPPILPHSHSFVKLFSSQRREPQKYHPIITQDWKKKDAVDACDAKGRNVAFLGCEEKKDVNFVRKPWLGNVAVCINQPVRLATLVRLFVVEGIGREDAEPEAVAWLVLGVRPF
jgi:hypothetical protein